MNRNRNLKLLKLAISGCDISSFVPSRIDASRVYLTSQESDVVTVMGTDEVYTKKQFEEIKAKSKSTWITFE
ncbi:MAG: hypothetical protein JWQ09_2984 [Segetibacter sp.]|nr:hypothetical protein [Segetibacter sp.]